MIIEQKLNHGGSRDLVRPAGRRRRADQPHREAGISSRATRAGRPTAGSSTSPPTSAARAICSASSVPGGAVEQVTKGARRLGGMTIDKAFTTIAYTVGVHDAPPDVFAANIDGTGERRLSDVHGGSSSEVAFSKAERLQWPSHDGTRDRGLADVPGRLRRREGPVSADRDEPRRSALGDRLQLRLQEAVLRRERLFRLRYELPQLDRLRRRVQVGDVGRVGQQGRRGRGLGDRLRPEALPDRSEARRPHRATRTAGS